MESKETAPSSAAPSVCSTLLKLLGSGIPIVVQQTCILLIAFITVGRVGRSVGPDALAALSLGNLTYNLLGLTLIMAPMTALETFASQAWGAKRLEEVGLCVQRALFVAALLLLPAAIAWLFAEPILRALGQPEPVVALAAQFLRSMLPVLPIQVCFEATKRFLYAQAVMWPPALAATLATLAHLCWLGPLVESLGFAGAPVALLCAHATMLSLLLAYIVLRRPHHPDTWPGLRPRRLWRDRASMGRFFRTSMYGLISLSEWVFWEAICFRR